MADTNPNAQGAENTQPPAENQQTQPPAQAAPETLAETLVKALDLRTQRAERSVLKSMSEQYGMSESELTAILDKAKAEKAKQLPADMQAKLDAANERASTLLLTAEVKSVGAEMGLIDPETALLLIDRTKAKVGDDGTVEGVKDALDALKTSKPYLFGKAGAMAQRQQQAPGTLTGVEEAFYRKNPNLKQS